MTAILSDFGLGEGAVRVSAMFCIFQVYLGIIKQALGSSKVEVERATVRFEIHRAMNPALPVGNYGYATWTIEKVAHHPRTRIPRYLPRLWPEVYAGQSAEHWMAHSGDATV